MNGGEEASQVIPAGSVRFFQLDLPQNVLNFPCCYSVSFLLVFVLCFFANKEEPVSPRGVIEAVIFDHLFCKRKLFFPEAVLFDHPRPEAPRVVIFMVDLLNDFLGDFDFSLRQLVVL